MRTGRRGPSRGTRLEEATLKKTIAVGGLVLLVLVSLAPTAGADQMQGYLQADGPVLMDGEAKALLQDPSLLITNPGGGVPDAPVLLHATDVTIVQRTLDIQSVEAPSYRLVVPGGDASERTYQFENVTIELSAFQQAAQVLVAPSPDQGLQLAASSQGPAQASGLETLEVLDGYRQHVGDNTTTTSNPFLYAYERPGPLVTVAETDRLHLSGGAASYVWATHVHVRNETGTLATFQTGRSVTTDATGTVHSEHYEYVLMDLQGFDARLAPGGLRTLSMADGVDVELDGHVDLSAPRGALSSASSQYRADPGTPASLAGNLTLALTAAPPGPDGPRLSVRVDGEVQHLTLSLVSQQPSLVTTETLVVGAGGVTVVGLAAAWYVFVFKGATLAPLVALPRREQVQVEATPLRPGDLLFDTDRFTLYHLIKAKAGLSADEAEQLTGIPDATDQLDRLVQHGLLDTMAERPRRYVLPGQLSPDRADRITFLRDPSSFEVATLLAIHGLMPERLLAERASRARPEVDARRLPRILAGLERRGLVIREPGREGPVADPTEELFTCLRLMGEHTAVHA